ncbi:type III-B CRISPR module-associated protein Cmr3 [Herpetosiphon llansteffanensis]|uniref:type III-B CRISPR module-associated protein Cmr3 n=1 Tax=Herpetosiphon llansteffanensis TaxID=2094568 RepID=UPI000D7C6BC3|nr:type III-B CRISPR module-associated protein Cmr3 [Herpetosiphon llansteffanensis]
MPLDLWLIQPINSLVVADGRPFENQPGSRAKSLNFPPPSVTVGGFRARAGVKANFDFSAKLSDLQYANLMAMQVRGPILLKESLDLLIPFVAAPADALIRQDGADVTCYRLQPLDPSLFPSNQTDLGNPQNPDQPSFALVGSKQETKGKAPANLPRFWNWDGMFLPWLMNPLTGPIDLQQKQIDGQILDLVRDTRTHVAIKASTQIAEDGRLFQTQGLNFHTLEASYSLGLWGENPIETAIASLGAERRLVKWQQPTTPISPYFTSIHPAILDAIKQAKRCRIVLLTPAIWDNGFYPSSLASFGLPIEIAVKAIVNPRPEYVSGWDLREKKPKATRRLAPAGTVLFVELAGSEDAIEQWASQFWFSNSSSDDQANNDGFGLAVLGTWNDGYLQELA